ncbi:MAG: DUF255 domain-containing protein [Cytophagales bacterium]|nr:DUF255 domain-containing protein [Cytophagales bacterium]MDW8383232.1 DUF255 domain-containing protein [Flammeovirgaceae bacterium]
MKKIVWIALLCFGLVGAARTVTEHRSPSTAKIHWITLEEAYQKIQVEPKKVFIDVYTDWCGWCHRMEATTFSMPIIANYMNQKYYCVKLNAEQKTDIRLGNDVYRYVPQGSRGYHEAAAALLQGRLSFPTVVFLDEKFRIIQPLPGYQDAASFHRVALFFGEDYYKKITWEQYLAKYDSIVAARQ